MNDETGSGNLRVKAVSGLWCYPVATTNSIIHNQLEITCNVKMIAISGWLQTEYWKELIVNLGPDNIVPVNIFLSQSITFIMSRLLYKELTIHSLPS